jgi:hypothetical protein
MDRHIILWQVTTRGEQRKRESEYIIMGGMLKLNLLFKLWYYIKTIKISVFLCDP